MESEAAPSEANSGSERGPRVPILALCSLSVMPGSSGATGGSLAATGPLVAPCYVPPAPSVGSPFPVPASRAAAGVENLQDPPSGTPIPRNFR
ncbi:MAG: hypothetical protein Fur0037_20910 [Planctomycetota bacterium]